MLVSLNNHVKMARQFVEFGFCVNEKDDVSKNTFVQFFDLWVCFRVALHRCTEQLDTVERKWPTF